MQRDLTAALEIERRLKCFFSDHILPLKGHGYSNQALDKLLAAIGGWANIGTRVPWPYRSVEESEAERLGAIARRYVPELFEI